VKVGKLFFLCFVLITSAINSSARTADARRAAEEREIQKLLAENNVPVLGRGLIRNGEHSAPAAYFMVKASSNL
jgi:hypothetical protein